MLKGAEKFKKAISIFEKKTGIKIKNTFFSDLLGYVDTPEGWYNEIKSSENKKFNGSWRFVLNPTNNKIYVSLNCEILLISCYEG